MIQITRSMQRWLFLGPKCNSGSLKCLFQCGTKLGPKELHTAVAELFSSLNELGVSWNRWMEMIPSATWKPVILRMCFAWARGITQMSSRSMVTWRIDIPGFWESVGSLLQCNFSQDLLFCVFVGNLIHIMWISQR